MTRPEGTVVLNADDSLVAAIARSVKAQVVLFSMDRANVRVRRHTARGGEAVTLEDGHVVANEGRKRRQVVAVVDLPATLGGLARHNVANALAAAAGAHAMGASWDEVADGLRSFRPTAEQMPGRLNLYRLGSRLVVVDYAHNEAGLSALLDLAESLLGPRSDRRGTVTAIVGTAGDRPDDSLRAVGRIAASRSDEVAIKETLRYLRGRTRQGVIGEIRAGIRAAGVRHAEVPVYDDEPSALRGELTTAGRMAALDDGTPRVVLIMCHADVPGAERMLLEMGARPVEDPSELQALRAG